MILYYQCLCLCTCIVHTLQPVSQIMVSAGHAVGIQLDDGTEIRANAVLSNATPKVTFLDLLEEVQDNCCYNGSVGLV